MRLAQFSFKEQAAQSEAEVAQLRTILLSRQTELRSTSRRCDELEAELAHARAETRRALAEVERLNAEKATLVESVKSLSKEARLPCSLKVRQAASRRRANAQVVKLDHFKRTLMKTLSDEDGAEQPPPSPALDLASLGAAPSPSRSVTAAPFSSVSAVPFSLGERSTAAPPAANGKEFFRLARQRLSADAYAALLGGIKRRVRSAHACASLTRSQPQRARRHRARGVGRGAHAVRRRERLDVRI